MPERKSIKPVPEYHTARREKLQVIVRIGSLLDVLAGAAAVDLEAEIDVLLVFGQMRMQAHSRIPGHSQIL